MVTAPVTEQPQRIKIVMRAYEHLSESETNRVIAKMNEFVAAVVKQKVKLADS